MKKELWTYVSWMLNESTDAPNVVDVDSNEMISEQDMLGSLTKMLQVASLASSVGSLAAADEDDDGNLLTEPDYTEDEEVESDKAEVSSGGVAGATTPLGTSATFPNPRVGHKKKTQEKRIMHAIAKYKPK